MEEKKREKSVDVLDRLFWTVQPPMGLVKGDYYRAENWFAPHFPGDKGYHGILEVVRRDGTLQMVEFNEINNPTYYIRRYQGVSKRLSDYGFLQATKERTAKSGVVLVNGLTHLEEQMVAENRLTGEFDLLTGASNSIKRSMLPLAEEIAGRLDKPSGQVYYGLSQAVEPGVTGRLQIVLEAGKIISCAYDEIFADRQEEIEDPELKPYYRQSKYHCPDYISTIGAGFNSIFDLLSARVLETQSLTDLTGLPFTEEPKRAKEWDNYLELARRWRMLWRPTACAEHTIRNVTAGGGFRNISPPRQEEYDEEESFRTVHRNVPALRDAGRLWPHRFQLDDHGRFRRWRQGYPDRCYPRVPHLHGPHGAGLHRDLSCHHPDV